MGGSAILQIREARTAMKILLVGNPGGTNVADSLLFAARQMKHEVSLVPATDAFRASDLRRRISWHLLGHKPPRLNAFSQRVLSDARAFQPDILIATGLAPIDAASLNELSGIRRVVFLTDDPWNRHFSAKWFFDALPHYDTVFTPRRANIEDLRAHGCTDVRFLRFGYDPRHFHSDPQTKTVDGFFAGAADAERTAFLTPILNGEFNVQLAGDFWAKQPATRDYAAGHFDPAELRRGTARARVNICMVRTANRDGHVMRSLEIPAVGGAMLVQDTSDHRDLFGDDVLYFDSPTGLESQFRLLMGDSALRESLAAAVHQRIVDGKHTYRDRLAALLGSSDPKA
jgi:spore maturation protein CgeB